MRLKKSFICVLILMILLKFNVFAQTREQIKVIKAASDTIAIKNLSEKFHKIYEENKEEAEQLAIKYNIPIRGTTPDGRYFELMRFEKGVPVYKITYNLNNELSNLPGGSNDKKYN